MSDIALQLAESIRQAAARRAPLRIRGGGTKDFYGGELHGEPLEIHAHSGIVDYEPTELVMTARAGTTLRDMENLLSEHGQMLAFEPPHFGAGATLGGAIAAGLSGPRRPHAGSARDIVLGVRILDGHGRELRFGGQVMKNVAGYDLSRMMVGSLGTLGVLLDVSLKVLPKPSSEITLRREATAADAIELMNAWAGKPLPITATCHMADQLYVRLSGAESAVQAARQKLGGEVIADSAAFWESLREHRLNIFTIARGLWRLSINSTTPPLVLPGEHVIEWSGALRWIASDGDSAMFREAAQRAGGHATLFRGRNKVAGVFHPLPSALFRLHQRLKEAFDPHRILNRGRLYPDL